MLRVRRPFIDLNTSIQFECAIDTGFHFDTSVPFRLPGIIDHASRPVGRHDPRRVQRESLLEPQTSFRQSTDGLTQYNYYVASTAYKSLETPSI